MKFRVERVHFMPRELQPGVLYVSEEFGAATHLCACGCGSKIRTPLSPTDWQLTTTGAGPTLTPSIGNWQKPCKSHYWIRNGEVHWSGEWTDEEIAAGRREEQERSRRYYKQLDRQRPGKLRRFGRWFVGLFKK